MMEMRQHFKKSSCFINILILVHNICSFVHSLPFPSEESNIQNNDHLKLLVNLQKAHFDVIAETTEQTIKPVFEELFKLPFFHPAIQEIHNETEFERNRGECQAPDSCLTKKPGENLCTVCEEDINAITDLIAFFKESRNATELLIMKEKCKHIINEYFLYSALTNVCDIKFPGFEYPSSIELFPGMYINKTDLDTVGREVSKKHRLKRQAEPRSSCPITVRVNPVFDGDANLNYFKEDYGYNSLHLNWHMLHRVGSNTDRRGELFYYVHQQMLARYDMERMSSGLDRVKSSGPLNKLIEEGYFPNLDPSRNGNEWARRNYYTMPRSIVENGRIRYDVENIKLWHSRLSQAAIDGFMINKDGQQVFLSDDVDINSGVRRGIDIFTAAAETDREISPNTDFYGNLHNAGHNIIAQLHDPENQQQIRTMGVMRSAAVAARDPAFYNWHKYFDDLIQEYKRTQTPYKQQRLELENIFLYEVKVGINSDNTIRHRRQARFSRLMNQETIDAKFLGNAGTENFADQSELQTGCNSYKIDISRGLDFGNQDCTVIADLKHLDHVPFHYNIFVANVKSERKNIMVRIFLAPKFDKYGQTLPLKEQRHLFVLLDKFRYTLNPGQNFIHRLSSESSVTSKCRNSRNDSTRQSLTDHGLFGGGHCGCGWPHHLLLPRGSSQGMIFQLFVLLTDWDLDYVPSNTRVSYLCGVVGDRYPDWQPMGYPFDRPFHQNVNYVDQLAENLPNAHVADVSIRFTGRNIINNEKCNSY